MMMFNSGVKLENTLVGNLCIWSLIALVQYLLYTYLITPFKLLYPYCVNVRTVVPLWGSIQDYIAA